MRKALLVALGIAFSCAGASTPSPTIPSPAPSHPAPRLGVRLEELTWIEAEKALTPDAVVVLPIGAASKEHGPHLLLSNDWKMAEYLRDRVLERTRVVAAPTLGYNYYPAFVEYPGSTSLRLETARDLVIDVCKGLARFGPRRFYALNTGVSTVRALEPAAAELAKEGIRLAYTDLLKELAPVEKSVCRQEGGTHADEAETSMMLVIAPESVDMTKAVKNYGDDRAGPLTRRPDMPGKYSPSGVWGDPTMATREKGEKIVSALVDAIVHDIDELRASPTP